jgi:hypothetical protein
MSKINNFTTGQVYDRVNALCSPLQDLRALYVPLDKLIPLDCGPAEDPEIVILPISLQEGLANITACTGDKDFFHLR